MIKWYARWVIDDIGTTQDFKIIEAELNNSIREVAYSNVIIDFNDYDETYIPLQYQEVTIIRINSDDSETIFFKTYVDTVKLPDYKALEQPVHIELSLMSLVSLLSKRNISIQYDNVTVEEAIDLITTPLADDGFSVIISTTIKDYKISDIFENESIEKIMNYLANRYNLIWWIDYMKIIWVYDIDYLLGITGVAMSISPTRNQEYVTNIQPIKTTVDYANVLNIKNMILISWYELLPENTDLISGESYMFTFPISISKNTCYRLDSYDPEADPQENYALSIETENTNIYQILINLDDETITYSTEIGFDGIDNNDATKKILLITDSSDTTKVLGFKWKGATETLSKTSYAGSCWSSTALIPYQTQYIDPVEVNKMSIKTSSTGKIEKLIDANGKYFTTNELQTYAVNIFKQNNIQTNECVLTTKYFTDSTSWAIIYWLALRIAETITLNFDDLNINNSFIITDTTHILGTETVEVIAKMRNKNVNENSMDIYRNEITQDNEDKLTRKLVALYNQDEKTLISKEIYVNGVLIDD